MGNRLAVRVSCDDTPIFFVSALLLVDDGQTTPYCLLLRPESPCRRGALDSASGKIGLHRRQDFTVSVAG
jgi:hypothetical protein